MPSLPSASLSWPRDLDLVAAAHAGSAAPCCVVAACARSARGWRSALGVGGHLTPGGPPAAPSTIFDLASVTKPFVALAAARLHRAHAILRAPLGSLLDEARQTPSERVPLELFLAHRAGLDGHRPLYAPLLRGEPALLAPSLHAAALARRPDCSGEPPDEGFAPTYSDLGYLLVGAALERVAGCSLADLLQREVISFLGDEILSARQLHDQDRLALVAPTEDVPFRGGVVRGAVHDENAWALGGLGVCGHAGLFGAAAAVARLGVLVAEALAGEHPGWLSPDDLLPLVRPRPGGTLRAGFDGKSEGGSSAGSLFGPRSIGHLGFTGTSLWIDPDQGWVAALLTNRVHPSRAHEAIKQARPAVHDAVGRWALGVGG